MFIGFRTILPQTCFFILVILSTCSNTAFAQNSTKKNRVHPNAIAAKAGTFIQWNDDLNLALETSDDTGKPVFWYVPTIRGTFMDRKTEIDRYMMAGLFSWPEIIDYLNENFVCVKAEPTREQQKQYELSRYKFVEPGFLIILNGRVTHRIDQVTTQHIPWFKGILARANPMKADQPEKTDLEKTDVGVDPNMADPAMSEMQYARNCIRLGMRQFAKGDHQGAKEQWQRLIDKYPNNPLAAKAAAEIQGIGPFTRGLEIMGPIPEKSMLAGIKSRGTRAPVGTFTEPDLWKRGSKFLLSMQHEQGGFFDSDYDFGGTDSLPNVHVAVSSLAGLALIESSSRNSKNPRDRNILESAIKRCFEFVTNEANLNKNDRDEILWAEAYRLRFICAYAKYRNLDDIPELQLATNGLENIQSKRGSWYHEYENSFVTATALAALYDAKTSGSSINQQKIDAGVKSLLNDRFINGAYPYYSRKQKQAPRDHEKSIQASAGRMPICELALARWGHSDQTRLKYAIEQSFKHHDKLAVALKYDNHTSTLAYGGFFFWYDMRSRTEAILAIEDKQLRDQFLKQQRDLVMALPELDGCFVDSHELGRCYGTAMALLCLAACSEPSSQ